jgi:hypothetical protein
MAMVNYTHGPNASINNYNTTHDKILKLSLFLSKHHSTKILAGIKAHILEFITSALDKT